MSWANIAGEDFTVYRSFPVYPEEVLTAQSIEAGGWLLKSLTLMR